MLGAPGVLNADDMHHGAQVAEEQEPSEQQRQALSSVHAHRGGG
jgi:hypothetical protein